MTDQVTALDLDMVLDDAEGRENYLADFAEDWSTWKRGLVDLLDEVRVEIATINVDLKSLRQGRSHTRRVEKEQERAALVERQRALETRLRYVKSQEPKRAAFVDEDGSDIARLRGHLFMALELVGKLQEEMLSESPVSE